MSYNILTLYRKKYQPNHDVVSGFSNIDGGVANTHSKLKPQTHILWFSVRVLNVAVWNLRQQKNQIIQVYAFDVNHCIVKHTKLVVYPCLAKETGYNCVYLYAFPPLTCLPLDHIDTLTFYTESFIPRWPFHRNNTCVCARALLSDTIFINMIPN